jgi:hypothetical protein
MTSHKPTSRGYPHDAQLDYFRIADKSESGGGQLSAFATTFPEADNLAILAAVDKPLSIAATGT